MFSKKTFQLNNDFSASFDKNKNLIILKGYNGFQILKCPSIYYYKISEKKEFFFLLTKRFFFKSFFSHLMNFYNKIYQFYYFKLRIKGLGFRIKKISNSLIRFFFNTTNYFYFHLPFNFIFKFRRRKFILIAFDRSILNLVIAHLLLLKSLVSYRTRGFIFPRQIITMKPGKKRF